MPGGKATAGGTPTEGSTPLLSRTSTDEEFAALRSYEPGDDVRQVHWRTSARLGRLVVQQFEQPWQRRTTVVLDVRRTAHDPESFERAVSAAASVVEHTAEQGDLVRLVTTDGTDSGVVGAEVESQLLDELAAVHLSGAGSLAATVGSLRGDESSGRLVVCTGVLEPMAHAALTEATRGWGLRILVVTGRCTPSNAPEPPLLIEHTGDDLTGAWRRGTAGAADTSRSSRPAADRTGIR